MNKAHVPSAPFVAYIAHELRTALATQRALLEFVLTDPGADIAAWREVGHDVLAACKQQERVLTACVTLSRSEAVRGGFEALDLAAIIAELLRAADLHGRTVTVRLEPAPTTGDPASIERLLDNLLTNAVRHNDARGRITIVAGTEAGRTVISIENTGTLVPADELARLVEPFEQIHPAAPHAGLGLGLAVVKAIADEHGALIEVHARPSGGLRVVLAFPSAVAPRDGCGASPVAQAGSHSRSSREARSERS